MTNQELNEMLKSIPNPVLDKIRGWLKRRSQTKRSMGVAPLVKDLQFEFDVSLKQGKAVALAYNLYLLEEK